jgi:hypothetical protein
MDDEPAPQRNHGVDDVGLTRSGPCSLPRLGRNDPGTMVRRDERVDERPGVTIRRLGRTDDAALTAVLERSEYPTGPSG